MASTISVPYTLLMDSGIVEAQTKDGPYAVVKFKCLTSNRYQLVKDLVGTTVASGTSIVRTYPFAYPPSPNLICRAIESIEQRGAPFPLISGITPWIGRQYSILTARFEPAAFFNNTSDPSGKPYTSTTLNMSSESITFPASTYTFPSGTPTVTPVGRQIPQIQISMKRFMLPYLPSAVMASLLGTVNNAAFVVGGLSCAVGTVLFTGGPVELNYDQLGNVTYQAEYQFMYKAIPWNSFMSGKPGEGFATPVDNGGQPVYSSSDFSTLP